MLLDFSIPRLILRQDEKLSQAVQQHGTNWTMIVSTSLPNRTPLALKNRYSALRAKPQQAPENPGQTSKPETSSWEPAEQSENDDDDDDEDDYEDDEEEEEGFAGNEVNHTETLDAGWQGSLPANPTAAQTRPSHTHPMSQFSFPFPNASEIQRTFSPPSAAVEHLGNQVQNPPLYPSTFPSHPLQSNYQQQGIQTSVPPAMGMNFGLDFNYTTSPKPNSHRYIDEYRDQHSSPPAQDPNSSVTQDVLMGEVSYATQKQQASQSINDPKSRPASRPSRSLSLAVQKGRSSPKRQRLRNEGPSTPDFLPGRSQAPEITSSSIQDLLVSRGGNTELAMHRVSVDAECTTDQLGDLMRTLVGSTKKVVVRVDG